MEYFVGIDIGTSSVKALALGEGAQSLGISQKSYPAHIEANGTYEIDPGVVYQLTLQALEDLLKQIEDVHSLKAISFSAAMHGLMALDEEGNPLTSLITWADTRAAAITRTYKDSPEARELYRITGTPIHPMSPLCKLRWINRTQPGLASRARKYISIKEYIWFRLFGVYEIDYSMASATGLFDTQALKWSPLALKEASVKEQQLSQPVSVFKQRSHPNTPIHGLPADTPFIIGGADGCLANLGTGVIQPKEASLTIGTSGAIRIVSPDWNPDPEGRLFQYLLTDGLYVRGGAINNGGNVLDWLLSLMGQGRPLKDLMQAAFKITPGSEGLMFLPYIYGERAPIWDAEASGAYVGLRGYHQKAHFFRAATEGISYALYDIGQRMSAQQPIEKIYVSGGFTQSPAWVQQVSDLFGLPVILSEDADASATGAIILAMLATGILSDIQDVTQLVKTRQTVYPNHTAHQTYQRYFSIYQELYPALSPSLNQLHSNDS
jgi:gluconokinase